LFGNDRAPSTPTPPAPVGQPVAAVAPSTDGSGLDGWMINHLFGRRGN
jgi:hypothetical protein